VVLVVVTMIVIMGVPQKGFWLVCLPSCVVHLATAHKDVNT